MMQKLVAEFIGTFFFLGVIIVAVEGMSKNIVEKSHAYLRIGFALAVAIILVGSISGGHLNPAVSFMFFLNKELNTFELLLYIVAQLLGAVSAFALFRYLYAHKQA
jgi:glycerol uptake facilitator-like aquaporin